MTFDQQVKALRGSTLPRNPNKKKADCTPEEWASKLDYDLAIRLASPEKPIARTLAWRKANPDKVQAQREKNREKKRAQDRDYRRRNAKKCNQYFSDRHRTDPSYRLICNLRTRLNRSIAGNYSTGSAVRDLGCTIEELWVYLESKFQPGMTRENLGVAWELDHIYPLSKANLQDKAEFLAANNWRNLQPLTPADNAAKKNKVTPEAQELFDSLVKEFGQRSPSE
jgi:hypothetical protein